MGSRLQFGLLSNTGAKFSKESRTVTALSRLMTSLGCASQYRVMTNNKDWKNGRTLAKYQAQKIFLIQRVAELAVYSICHLY